MPDIEEFERGAVEPAPTDAELLQSPRVPLPGEEKLPSYVQHPTHPSQRAVPYTEPPALGAVRRMARNPREVVLPHLESTNPQVSTCAHVHAPTGDSMGARQGARGPRARA